MSMGWDLSLRTAAITGLLFIPRWYMSVESRSDDDAGWGKFSTRPPELSGSPTSRDIWERVGGMEEWSQNFAYQYLR
jgi:hypothetical protein